MHTVSLNCLKATTVPSDSENPLFYQPPCKPNEPSQYDAYLNLLEDHTATTSIDNVSNHTTQFEVTADQTEDVALRALNPSIQEECFFTEAEAESFRDAVKHTFDSLLSFEAHSTKEAAVPAATASSDNVPNHTTQLEVTADKTKPDVLRPSSTSKQIGYFWTRAEDAGLRVALSSTCEDSAKLVWISVAEALKNNTHLPLRDPPRSANACRDRARLLKLKRFRPKSCKKPGRNYSQWVEAEKKVVHKAVKRTHELEIAISWDKVAADVQTACKRNIPRSSEACRVYAQRNNLTTYMPNQNQ
ncbi:MAG: hypothetical protein S4CHLAM37_01330 [Chlamydiia bacterium]|nr:hypothetical protein [Chlamydiia bacterium]